jgi:quinate/shikimate dehydrogenase (NAD+)
MSTLSNAPVEPDHPVRPRYLIGLIGAGIQRSRSPAMHEAEADAHHLRCIYQLVDLQTLGRGIDSLPALVEAAEAMGFCGFNVTHPCKQAILPILTETSDEAGVIGAVNTVRLLAGRRIGYNTDAAGFAASFRRGLPDAPIERIVQIGAGGAGAATAYAMLTLGAGHVAIHDAEQARAEALVERFARRFGVERLSVCPELRAGIDDAQGIVHATPTGTWEHPGIPVPVDSLRPSLWVADIVYFPLRTELLKCAAEHGCRVLDGGGMAVFQAAAAFEIFTDHPADRERMLRRFHSQGGD